MTKTLLAVEDSKTMRKVLGITFASEEFETVLVDSAQDGLAKLEQLRPDLALVDVTLAEISGYDLCRRLKSRVPGMPVMLLSSRQQPYDPVRGADAGVDDFIDKPFDTQQIRDKVAKLCAKNGAVARPAAERVSVPAAAPRSPPGVAARAPQNSAQYPPHSPVQSPAQGGGGPPPRPSLQVGPERRGASGNAQAGAASASSVSASLRAVAGAAPAAGVANDAGDGAANALVSGALMERLQGLDLSAEQVAAVLSISREVIERVVWEVVPVLAETLIKEEIARLTRE